MYVKLEHAIEIVLDLAKENVLSEGNAAENELEEERERQLASIDTIEDFFTNHVFDGTEPQTYTLDAGRCIVRDGQQIATVHGVVDQQTGRYVIGHPADLDDFAHPLERATWQLFKAGLALTLAGLLLLFVIGLPVACGMAVLAVLA